MQDFNDNEPISLHEAAQIVLRGLVKVSTLRAAADRGDLVIEKLGRRVVTTPANVSEWRLKCRVIQNRRDYICGTQEGNQTSLAGSLKTERLRLAQAAALATAKALKSN